MIKLTAAIPFFALGVSLLTSLPASANTIDFSTFSPGSALSFFDGVTFSLMGGPMSAGTPTLANYGGGLTNTTDGGGYPTANILDFSFSTPVDAVSFVFNNEGSSSGGRGASYYAAYAGSALVTTGSLNGASDSSFTVTGSGITDLQFNNATGGTGSWWFMVDSVTFTPAAVPEPASMAVLGAGLVGLGATSRRRRA